MQLEWEGKTYEWDPDADIGVAESMAIHRHTGYGQRSFTRGIDEGEPLCLQAFLWVVKKANGERSSIDHLDFSIPAFHRAVQEMARVERERLIAIELAKAAADERAGKAKKANPSRPAPAKQAKKTRTSAGGATPGSSASPTSAT